VRKTRAKKIDKIDIVAVIFSRTPEEMQKKARQWGELGCRSLPRAATGASFQPASGW